MLEALTLLLLFQLFGEMLVYVFALPLPGPVIGMVGLFFCWPYLGKLQAAVEQVGSSLLAHLGLLFVPAGVGVILHLDLLASWSGPLLLALLASTALTMAMTVWIFTRFGKRGDKA
nr:putative CidA/LrgA family protein [uncultured bacterium]